VLGLFLIFVIVFIGFTVLFVGGTLFVQRYLYNEPVTELYWRAPLAALVLTLFLAFWVRLDYRAPGNYNALFDFAPPEEGERFKQFWSVKNNKETLFKAERNRQGGVVYRDPANREWRRSDTEGIMKAIIVEENGEKIRFEAPTTPDGKFKLGPDQTVRYVEQGGRGRIMGEDSVGYLARPRRGLAFLNLFLNGFHLAVWFLCLWLLLRFQWGHALGLAFVFWLALTFFLPALFNKAEETARRRRAATLAVAAGHVEARICMMSPSCTM
jgi:hypothetical protein